jgi:hypothetical protein
MKKEWMGSLVLVSALALSACGKEHKEYLVQSDFNVNQSESAAEAKTATTGESWKQVKNFAQSIEGASFAFSTSSRVAKLGFHFVNLDDVDEKGVPYLTHVFELRGTVGASGSGTLLDPRAPDYVATVKCPDAKCNNAEIELSKLTGAKGAGKAVLRVLRNIEARGIVGEGLIKTPDSARVQAASELKKGQHRAFVTFTEIEGGLHNLFDITFKFSNASLNRASPDYFERKEVVLSGHVGKGVLVNISVASQNGGITLQNTGSAVADVQFDVDHASVAIQFAEADGMTFITAGQDVADKEKKRE